MLNIRRFAPRFGVLLQHASIRTVTQTPTPKPPAAIPPPDAQQLLQLSCKAKRLNLLTDTRVPTTSKFGTIELASAGWKHHKAKGDHFTIHPTHQPASHNDADTPSIAFDQLGLDERIVHNLRTQFAHTFTECSDIQSKAVPLILAGDHTLIAAETGCGKTLAYLVPIVQQLLQRKRGEVDGGQQRTMNTPRALVLTPGRELASQIGQVAEKLCDGLDISVSVLLGGRTKQKMLNPSMDQVDLLIGTMGATSKLSTTGVFRMHRCEHVVLDEADTLLDDSFSPKLAHFLKRFPFHRNHLADNQQPEADAHGTQLILASATMPTNATELLQTVVDPSTVHEVMGSRLHRIQSHVEQRFVRMNKTGRPVELLRVLRDELAHRRPVIVFSNKSATSDFVSMFVNENGLECVNLNGDMAAALRLGQFERFQAGEVDVLSTTDMASRGLDTTRARHIVNFDFPLHMADYIHRIGRIGRLGSGPADRCRVTNFVSSAREIDLVQRIEHTARTRGVLPNVNANITNIIKTKIMREMSVDMKGEMST